MGSSWAHIFCKIDFSTHWKETQNGKEKCKGSLCSSCQFPWKWKSILPGLMWGNYQIRSLSPHFPTHLASWMVSRPGSKRATKGLKLAFSWADSGEIQGYACHIHDNLLPAIYPSFCHQAHWTQCPCGKSHGQLSAWLPPTVHQSLTQVHGQTSAFGGRGGTEGNLFLGALKYHFLFESFPKCLSAILKTNFGKVASILIMWNALKGKDLSSFQLYVANTQGQAWLHEAAVQSESGPWTWAQDTWMWAWVCSRPATNLMCKLAKWLMILTAGSCCKDQIKPGLCSHRRR